MHDANPGVPKIEPLFRTLRLQNDFVPHQIKVLQFRVIPQGINGSSDIDGGGMIPTHGVQCDFHMGLKQMQRRQVMDWIRKITV
jgi:hypothetical protein